MLYPGFALVLLLVQILLAVVLIAGAVLAGMRRREHGRAATIGMVGCLVLLLEMALSTVLQLMLPSIVSSAGESLAATMLFGAVTLILRIGGIALLIWAVIARRTPTAQATPWPHPAAGHPGAQHPGWPQPGHSGEQHAGWQQPGGQPQQGQPGWQQPGQPHPGAHPGWPQQ